MYLVGLSQTMRNGVILADVLNGTSNPRRISRKLYLLTNYNIIIKTLMNCFRLVMKILDRPNENSKVNRVGNKYCLAIMKNGDNVINEHDYFYGRPLSVLTS
jgi:hypothetical protein